MYPTIQLKAGREASVGFRHPWVFSGALEGRPNDIPQGALVYLSDRRGEIIGTGTYSAVGSIAVRVFDFSKAVINEDWLVARLNTCLSVRQALGYGKNTKTTGYRLVHGEADGLPGLVVDVYGDVMVMQISTSGMDQLRSAVISALQTVLAPAVMFEKSDMPVREEEGLPAFTHLHVGTLPDEVTFLEHGLTFTAQPQTGQKTGFFLDQKELRGSITQFARDKRVLNLFSYTGASSVALLNAGAASVHNIDSSQEALGLIARQGALNDIAELALSTEEADVFQWLGQENRENYDMVLLDPPALVKTKKEQEAAMKAYHFLNRAAMRLVQDRGILVTSSCSHFVSEDDLMFVLRRASVQAGVDLRCLATVRQAPDHPVSVYFPESLYLKSFVFQLRKS